jgi:hypothetical protein
MFSVMCPGTLFMQTAASPHEHEKLCIEVSCPEHRGMHYVTRRSHQMQKHKFGITCLTSLLMNPYRAHMSMKSSVLTFNAQDALECTT